MFYILLVIIVSIKVSTGLVRAAGYADKLRKVLIAKTRNKVPPKEAVRVAAHINQHLFKVLQENRVEKSDVVRIFLNVDVVGDKILVDWKSLTIEVYKPTAELKVETITAPLPPKAEIAEKEAKAAPERVEGPEAAEKIPTEQAEVKPTEIPKEEAPAAEVREAKVEAAPPEKVEAIEEKPKVGLTYKIKSIFRKLFKR